MTTADAGGVEALRTFVAEGIPAGLPELPMWDDSVPHAPARPLTLTAEEQKLAIRNALRYVPREHHAVMARECAQELREHGRIYLYRYRPTQYAMTAYPLNAYPARCKQAAAIMLMITNNLDPAVAQHPHELITYGGTGTVFQNWAQYRLVMHYLSEMTEEQTLVLYSGHPLGLFPSHPDAPRVVVTNGMTVPNYSKPEDYTRLAALGVTSYGQMTAGSFMYIGPQGIVHGTTLTLLNAGRLWLGLEADDSLRGKIFVTSGLGGMSGAQGKAAVIAGAVGVIAEVNPAAAQKRLEQGWITSLSDNLDVLVEQIKTARNSGMGVALGYLGNIVDLWEGLSARGIHVDLGSDQTSLHIPYTGGYYPAGLSFDDANRLMIADPDAFKTKVQESLRRHATAVQAHTDQGMYFWDYGNAFLLECERAGVEGLTNPGAKPVPSYVEDIMGPMCFDFGFGPFRWVCCSGDPADLARTDAIAADVIQQLAADAPPETRQQYFDNLRWIQQAGANKLVVGSQARILYSDEQGRIAIARAFNDAIKAGELRGPVVLGRDHHDVSGTDSPYRETANIKDGSNLTADMAVQNVIGDGFRGATWVSIHNGGGVGWGEVINGGFGMLLDGTPEADRRLDAMLFWDVNNGIARRSWARNENARFAIERAMQREPRLRVTLPELVDDDIIDDSLHSM